MDSYPSPIPIQNSWTIPLNTLQSLRPTIILRSGKKEIKELPGIQFGMEMKVVVSCNYLFRTGLYLRLFNLKKDMNIRANFSYYISGFKTPSEICIFNVEQCIHGRKIFNFPDDLKPENQLIVNDELKIEVKGLLYVVEPKIEKVIVEASGDSDSDESIDRNDDGDGNDKPRFIRSIVKRNDEKSVKAENSLGNRLWNSNNKDFSIVINKDCDTASIKVHKIILASSSTFFEKLINENGENMIKINLYDLKTVKNAIKFYYDQDISQFLKRLKNAIELFKFSSEYEMEELKQQLELHFVKILSPENVCQISNAAVSTNSQKLRDLCSRTLLIFLKESLPFDNFKILDKDFAFEIIKKYNPLI
uniref:BTB domain-containing protein n=1 Tax=Panagrolaimus davidi TaxID=227884 RepID=A0A914QMS7_9BILA